MSTDFAALTSAFAAGLPDVRACLIVSRDGLSLGSHPAGEESRALSVWGRVQELGDVERGFAVVGDELWVFCRRGPYAALAIAGASSRAGVVLDRLEQMALVAEEGRLRKEGLRVTASEPEPPRRGRRSLHRERAASKPDREVEPVIVTDAAAPADVVEVVVATNEAAPPEQDWMEVDAVALAREFAGLLPADADDSKE
jgi:hypothetical protein